MSSLYHKKLQRKEKNQSWQSWDDDKINFVCSEYQIPDMRQLHKREDGDGDRVLPSSDESCEILCFSWTKPDSGGSVASALKEKRAIPILAYSGMNYLHAYEVSKFWESAINLELPEAALPELSKVLSEFYARWDCQPLSLHDYIDEEERVKLRAKLKYGVKSKKKGCTHYDIGDPEGAGETSTFAEMFKEEVQNAQKAKNSAAAPPTQAYQSPNPRDKKRTRAVWPPRVQPADGQSSAVSSGLPEAPTLPTAPPVPLVPGLAADGAPPLHHQDQNMG